MSAHVACPHAFFFIHCAATPSELVGEVGGNASAPGEVVPVVLEDDDGGDGTGGNSSRVGLCSKGTPANSCMNCFLRAIQIFNLRVCTCPLFSSRSSCRDLGGLLEGPRTRFVTPFSRWLRREIQMFNLCFSCASFVFCSSASFFFFSSGSSWRDL